MHNHSDLKAQPGSALALDVRDLNVAIGGQRILNKVSFHVAEHERVGLIGASGSGKSMIARAILALLPAQAQLSGSIQLLNHEIVAASEHALADMRGRLVGVVFQNPATTLNPVMTVGKQIALPLRLHYDMPADERNSRVAAMIRTVGLPQTCVDAFPHELSGGQQQRVAIATALITSPRIIIADEPTTALDSITQGQIVELLVDIVDRAGASMLFITHDFGVLARATQRSIVIDDGSIIDAGATAELLAHPSHHVTRQLAESAAELSFHGIDTHRFGRDASSVTDHNTKGTHDE